MTQWPLTAAATRELLAAPPAGADRGNMLPDSNTALSLCVQELVLRGAYRIGIQKRRWRRDNATLSRGRRVELPPTLEALDARLAPLDPGGIAQTVRRAREREPDLVKEVVADCREELARRRLLEEHRKEILGVFTTWRWRRTAEGDGWALTAAQHRTELAHLRAQVEESPEQAASIARAAGSITLLVPASLGSIARLGRHLREGGGKVGTPVTETTSAHDGDLGALFDPLQAVRDTLGSLHAGMDANLDPGIEALTSALESIQYAIDSALEERFGWWGGGGIGDGGGDGGGGGG